MIVHRIPVKNRALAALSLAIAIAACFAAAALGRSSTAPENTVPPSVSGAPKEGSTLTATTGTWANSPSSYVYKWQRCGTDGTGCTDVVSGSKNTYTLTAADVMHTVRVVVTGVNADGRGDAAPSDATAVVSSKSGPTNSVPPSIDVQRPKVGDRLTASPGTWSPTPTSYAYQWQRCDTDNGTCLNVPLAKSSTYVARYSDVGSKLRVLVTAKTTTGSTSRYTANTAYVQSDTPAPTVNQAPTLQFISAVRVGRRVYARFRVCDDGLGRITVVERDTKAGQLAYTRRYSVYTYASCGTFSRSWTPAPRFRTRGRMTVTLQAVDKSQKKSAIRSKSLYRR